MSDNLKKSVWLIGAGQMAVDYYKVLSRLDVNITVIGRSKKSANFFLKETGMKPIIGGIENHLIKEINLCDYAIVCAQIELLSKMTIELLKFGIKNILVEKPVSLNTKELTDCVNLARKLNADVYVGYNRRFYSSVAKAKEIIYKDGGLTSMSFEFTEWSKKIEKSNYSSSVKRKWFLANSSHLVDLAFYLAGKPKEIFSNVKGSLSWHPSGSIFHGHGITLNNVPFSYRANWESAGSWSLELMTRNRKLILCPLEKLKIQKKESFDIKYDENVDNSLDERFKPGLYNQVSNFINSNTKNLLNINDLVELFECYYKIANYN